jgi:hypothetical protein
MRWPEQIAGAPGVDGVTFEQIDLSGRCFALRFLWIVERHFCELGLADV